MRKFSVLSFSFIVTALTTYGLLFPNYLLQEFVSFSEPFILARLFIVLLLFTYVLFPAVRLKGMRQFLLLISLVVLSFGVTTMFSPMFFGRLSDYVPIVDVLIFLEGGIIGLLMVAELPIVRSEAILSPQFIKQLKTVQYSRLVNQNS